MMSVNQFERISNGVTIESETQDHVFFTTINPYKNGRVREIFVRLDDAELFEMITLVTRLSSAL